MYLGVIHRISDPEGFEAAEATACRRHQPIHV